MDVSFKPTKAEDIELTVSITGKVREFQALADSIRDAITPEQPTAEQKALGARPPVIPSSPAADFMRKLAAMIGDASKTVSDERDISWNGVMPRPAPSGLERPGGSQP